MSLAKSVIILISNKSWEICALNKVQITKLNCLILFMFLIIPLETFFCLPNMKRLSVLSIFLPKFYDLHATSYLLMLLYTTYIR